MKPNGFRSATLVFCLLFSPLAFFAAGTARAQVINNGPQDLSGENMGDFIILWWSDDPSISITTYVMYRSPSQTGPWQEIGRMQADVSIISGGKVDYTPDARLKTLCYKVEALDAAGRVVRTYQPMCIPKYAEQQ
jgi:hypothetical protein